MQRIRYLKYHPTEIPLARSALLGVIHTFSIRWLAACIIVPPGLLFRQFPPDISLVPVVFLAPALFLSLCSEQRSITKIQSLLLLLSSKCSVRNTNTVKFAPDGYSTSSSQYVDASKISGYVLAQPLPHIKITCLHYLFVVSKYSVSEHNPPSLLDADSTSASKYGERQASQLCYVLGTAPRSLSKIQLPHYFCFLQKCFWVSGSEHTPVSFFVRSDQHELVDTENASRSTVMCLAPPCYHL